MERAKLRFLDIPIIRSCNLNCRGCLTFSDSKHVKGLVNLYESLPWLTVWAEKIEPDIVTVFGGEPLLHPRFVEWCKAIRNLWPNCELRINTNGYYLDRLLTNIPDLFNLDIRPQFIVSIQTGHDPYFSIVKNHIEKLKADILTSVKARYPNDNIRWNLWLDEPELFKQWWCVEINGNDSNIRITITEQFNQAWQAHYSGFESSLKPFYKYDDTHFVENHKWCQARNFVNLFKGNLYKCPTTAVLQNTLETFNLTNDPDWEEYLNNYNSINFSADVEQIKNWLDTQAKPEQVCNMCGFTGPKWQNGHLNRHELKENWNYQVIGIKS